MIPLPMFMNLFNKHYSNELFEDNYSAFPKEIIVKDEKHQWRELHCPRCKDGIITEKYFDTEAAVNYLESIGQLTLPFPGITMEAHLMSACYIAQQRGDNIEFFKEKCYPCIHNYCKDKIPNL